MTDLSLGIDGSRQRTTGSIELSGTDRSLHFDSGKQHGSHEFHRLEIPVSGEYVPPSLKRIELRIEIAGQIHEWTYPAEPNQTHVFHWDGRDTYGHLVGGAQYVDYVLSYVYPAYYLVPRYQSVGAGRAGRAGSSFARRPREVPDDVTTSGVINLGGLEYYLVPAREDEEIYFPFYVDGYRMGVVVSHADDRSRGLGGWSLDAHHVFDPGSRILYRGDGTERWIPPADWGPEGAVAVGGDVENVSGVDPLARTSDPTGTTVGPDGSLYVANQTDGTIKKFGPDGTSTIVAGIPTVLRRDPDWEAPADSDLAVETVLDTPTRVAVADDGSIYFTEHWNHTVKRVAPDGTLSLVAGTTEAGYSGDGGPATEARLAGPVGIAIADDGSLLVTEDENHVVRRIDPAGTISTFAGTGDRGYTGDEGPASTATFDAPSGIDLGPDGSAYVCDADNGVVRRIFPDKRIETVAGDALTVGVGLEDSIPATDADLYEPNGIAVADDGSFLIADSLNYAVRRVDADGTITTVAGTGETGYSGDGEPATAATFRLPVDVTLAPDGGFYVADWGSSVVRRVTPSGTIELVAGRRAPADRSFDPIGYGEPANTSTLVDPMDVAAGEDGSVYVALPLGNVVVRVAPDGTLEPFAGTGMEGYSGDGGPATAANLFAPSHVAVGPDGSVYVSCERTVRRVAPDGTISRVAGIPGSPFGEYGGDSDDATTTALAQPMGLDVDDHGTVYVADVDGLRAIGLDGSIYTIAGGGKDDPSEEGSAFNASLVYVQAVAVATDGTIYLADGEESLVYAIGLDGVLRIHVGGGTGRDAPEEGPATEVLLGEITSMTVDDSGFLFLTHQNADGIFVVNPEGTLSRAVEADRTPLLDPSGIDVSQDGSLYVADRSTDAVGVVPVETFPTDTQVASSDGRYVYEFGVGGRHLRTLDGLTGETVRTFEYDDGGLLVGLTDLDGDRITIERGADGRMTGIVGPGGTRTATTVDDQGYVTAATGPTGHEVGFEYDDGLLVGATDANGKRTGFAYDRLGRLAEARWADGGVTTLVREDAANGYTVTLTSPAGRTREVTNATGPDGTLGVADLTQGIGAALTPDGRAHVAVGDAELTTATLSTDPQFGWQAPYQSSMLTRNGTLRFQRSVVESAATGSDGPLDLDRLVREQTILGSTRRDEYKGADRSVTTTLPSGRVLTGRIDAAGRPLERDGPGLATETITYDDSGHPHQLIRSSGGDRRTYRLEWTPSGELRRLTDPLGNVVTFDLDAAGRVVGETFPDGNSIRYRSDPAGNVTGVTPPGRPEHEFEYDAMNRLVRWAFPAVDGTTDATTYEYDADGNPTAIDSPTGERLEMAYDDLDRIVEGNLDGESVAFEYLDQMPLITRTSGPDGTGLEVSYEGTLPRELSATGPVVGTVAWTYDDALRFATRSIDGESPIEYGYDPDGLLSRVGSLFIERDGPTGHVTGAQIGALDESWGISPFGEVTDYRATRGRTTLYAGDYERDARGFLVRADETVDGDATDREFRYDATGRLAAVLEAGTTVEEFEYDANGNVVRRVQEGTVTTATYDARDRLVAHGDRTYDYDAAGRLSSIDGPDGTTALTYDVLRSLRTVSLPDGRDVEYLVDAGGRRVGKHIDGSLRRGWLYGIADRVVAEYDGGGRLVSKFVYGTFDHVPDYMVKDGHTYRIFTDHLGSPRLVVDTDSGSVAQRLDYDVLGRVTRDTNPGFQPFGFAGGLYDPDTGFVRFGARDYDPVTGRWTAPDPIGFAGGSSNLYEYALGNPVNFIDPTGLAVGDGIDWGEAGITAAGVTASVLGGIAVAGLVPTVGWAIVGTIAVGAIIGAVEQTAKNAYSRSKGNCVAVSQDVGKSAAIGGLWGGLGIGIGKYAARKAFWVGIDVPRWKNLQAVPDQLVSKNVATQTGKYRAIIAAGIGAGEAGSRATSAVSGRTGDSCGGGCR